MASIDFHERYRSPTINGEEGYEFILFARFRLDIGGYWLGYIGRTDGVQCEEDDFDLPGGVTGWCSAHRIPGFERENFPLPGFDTLHPGDRNFTPDGAPANNIPSRLFDNHWTRETVFAALRRAADAY